MKKLNILICAIATIVCFSTTSYAADTESNNTVSSTDVTTVNGTAPELQTAENRENVDAISTGSIHTNDTFTDSK